MSDDDGSVGESGGGGFAGSNRGNDSGSENSSDDDSEQMCEVTGTRQTTPCKKRSGFMSDDEDEAEAEVEPRRSPRRSPRLKRLGRGSSMPPSMGKLTYRNGGGDPETSESKNEDALRKQINPA